MTPSDTPGAAIPAATLVTWRDPPAGSDGLPRILVVERSAQMAFAAGALVFPGGRIDAADRDLADALGRPDDAAKISAIRETIEESAVAPALTGDVTPALGLALQQSLIDGAPFADLLDAHGLALDLAALVPFARWLPAFHHARTFDTMFFLARAPAPAPASATAPAGDWAPRPQPGECVAAEWASPAELIARIDRGEASAIFPTRRNLERLARHADFAAAVADANAFAIDTITPWIEDIDGQRHVCIPDGRGYPVTREPLDTAFRA